MAEKRKKAKFLREFEDFALKGNMFDMATGVIIGAIFKDLVASFTDNVIMPVVSIFTGNVDFAAWRIPLPSLFGDKIDPETGKVVTNFLNFGDFLSSAIDFLILSFVIFAMIKAIGRLRERRAKGEEPKAPPEPEKSELLLTEIRDLLKERTERSFSGADRAERDF